MASGVKEVKRSAPRRIVAEAKTTLNISVDFQHITAVLQVPIILFSQIYVPLNKHFCKIFTFALRFFWCPTGVLIQEVLVCIS
jgi:hypothetical protein